jgi:hypothetical protein
VDPELFITIAYGAMVVLAAVFGLFVVRYEHRRDAAATDAACATSESGRRPMVVSLADGDH